MKTSRLSATLRGARDTLPLLPGGVPFGLIYAVAAISAGIPAWLAQAMSAVIFAGSAQFAVVQLVGAGAPAVILVLTGGILNLRHLLYSASLAPELRPTRPRWKVLLAYLLTDEMYGVVSARPRLRAGLTPAELRWYALGSGLTLWCEWQLSTLAGLLLGAQIPSAWSLDFAATLTFIALVVPLLRDRPSGLAAAVAALAAALMVNVPLKLGLVGAIVVGVLVGLLAERRASGSGVRQVPEVPAMVNPSPASDDQRGDAPATPEHP